MKQRIKLAFIAAVMTASIAPAVSFAQVAIDKVVAVVASEPITQKELNSRISINREMAKRAGQTPSDAELFDYSRNELITERLLLNKAKNARVNVTQTQVDTAIDQIAQANGLTLEQFKQRVAKEGGANGWSELTNDLNKQMLIDAMMQKEVLSKVKEPTTKEIDVEIKRVMALPDSPMAPQAAAVAQHIFIQDTTPASLKAIKAAKKRVDGGEDFATVAKAVSQNPQTAANGGMVPYVFLNDKNADETIVKLANEAPLNQITEPVKTKNGYHIFKFLERTTLTPTEEDKKAWAKEALMSTRQKEVLTAFYKDLDASRDSLVEIKN